MKSLITAFAVSVAAFAFGAPSVSYNVATNIACRAVTNNVAPWALIGQPKPSGCVDTNAVIDIIHKTVDGAARPLPKYLWLYEADDSYPDAAQEYYRSRGNGKADGGCSSVRSGGYLSRNFDFPFDDRAEFVVKMSAGPGRFASVGVAQVGTNLTEQMVTSGKPEYSARYKWLPGATVDGVNENGVACNINVVDGDPQTSGWHATGDLHPLAAVRWILDHATNAQHGAEYIAANIRFPDGWTQNYHYMIFDGTKVFHVIDGIADEFLGDPCVITNWKDYQGGGSGYERTDLLLNGANITNVWYTNAYRRDTNPPWVSDLAEVIDYTNDIYNAWASHPKEYFRNKTTNGQPWWQSIHTSIYDITNRTLRVAVQETDDWYVFAIPGGTGVSPVQARAIAAEVVAPVASSVSDLASSVSRLESSKLDGPTVAPSTEAGEGKAADAKATAEELSAKLDGPIDETLSMPGLAADAAKVGEELSNKVDSSMPAFFDFIDIFYEYSPLNLRIYFDGEFSYDDEDGNTNVMKLPTGGVIDRFATESQVSGKFDTSRVSSTDTTFTNAVIQTVGAKIDHTDIHFSNEVLAVGIDTNVLAAVSWIASSTNAVAQIGEFYAALESIGITPAEGGMTLGGLLAAIVALLVWVKRTLAKVAENDGNPTDTFATDLLGKPVAINALKIPLEAKADSFVADDGHAYAVTMTGTVTITMPTTTEGKAAIFQARFSAAAQQSVQFSTDAVIKFDGADCGVVKAGKDALLSAMWNGTAWDLVWKNQA